MDQAASNLAPARYTLSRAVSQLNSGIELAGQSSRYTTSCAGGLKMRPGQLIEPLFCNKKAKRGRGTWDQERCRLPQICHLAASDELFR